MYPGIPPWGRSGVDEGFSCLDATLGACGEELGEPHSILTCGADGCISPRARDQIELELESDPSPSSSPLLSFTPSPLHPPFVRTISYRGVLQFATSGCACRVALLGTHPGCLKTRWADPACPVWREMDRVVADIELEGSVKVPPQPEASGETTISADCSLALGRYWRTAMMGPHTDELRCLWGALWPAEWVSTPAPARGAGRWGGGGGRSDGICREPHQPHQLARSPLPLRRQYTATRFRLAANQTVALLVTVERIQVLWADHVCKADASGTNRSTVLSTLQPQTGISIARARLHRLRGLLEALPTPPLMVRWQLGISFGPFLTFCQPYIPSAPCDIFYFGPMLIGC